MSRRSRKVLAGAALAGAVGALAWRTASRMREVDLRGKVILITGGSRGLGFLMAREFVDAGSRVAICARDEQELETARHELEDRGADVLALRCNIADRTQVEALVHQVVTRFGEIDVLVNNAGIIQVGPLATMHLEDFEQAMDTNFWGAVYATLAVLPAMRARRSGRIVNITSIGSKVAVPHLIPYDCAKFALRGFSEGLRAELKKDGITVVTIVPGLMRTGSPVNALFKGQHAKEYTWFSLGDALPITAMSAQRAARRIVTATRRGEAEVTLSWQARLLGLVHDLFPGATADFLGVVDRFLPRADGDTGAPVRGMRLSSALSPSPLTMLMNRAARSFNQFGGEVEPAPEHARKIGLTG